MYQVTPAQGDFKSNQYQLVENIIWPDGDRTRKTQKSQKYDFVTMPGQRVVGSF